ncbi:MAG: PfkB family carbohydrate kinase, partial [Hyphomicrobium sp.]
TVEAVAAAAVRHGLRPLVVDPVMVATSGDPLLTDNAIDAVRRLLLPLATLATPNLDEAAKLTGQSRARNVAEAEAQGQAILALGPKAVLVKGGHGEGDVVTDVLVSANAPPQHFSSPRIDTRHTHGTGCTLSASITAFLVLGYPLDDAVRLAKAFVWEALRHGAKLQVGHGNGPVDHLHAIRRLPQQL